MKTFSIITPSYNQADYLDATITSVLSQEGDFYLDYIIMDGGSADDSPEIIKKYDELLRAGQWQVKCGGIRYRWVSEKDKGQVDALQKGFVLADGDIGVWLNSDDIFNDSLVLSRVLTVFALDENVDIVTGDGLFIDKQGQEFGRHYVEKLNLTELLYLDYHILQPATFIRSRIFKNEILDASFNFCFDAEYFIRLLLKGFKFEKIQDDLACFRLYPETKTASGMTRRYRESLRISREYGDSQFYQVVSTGYKFFEIVLQNKYPESAFVRTVTEKLRRLAYQLITGRPER